jgi:TaqI-like C-terminal specificity domain
VFEGVTTYPAILTMQRGAAPKKHELQFWNVAELPASNFRATFRAQAGPYPQSALTNGSWELESPALRELRAKIRDGKQTLKDVYGSPLYGIKTGLNAAFVIDSPTKERLCAEDPKSADLLMPFLEGKDLKRWRAEPRGLWLIYIPKNRVQIDDYPAIRDWLLPFKGKLEMRATKQEWFELQQAQEAYQKHFEGVKIVYKDIADSTPFFVDSGGNYLANTGYFIPSDEFGLLAYLNSSLCWFTYLTMSAQIRGGFVRFFGQFLQELPIAPASSKQKAALATLAETCQTHAEARYALQESLRRRIPDLCPPERDRKLNTKLKEWWLLPEFAGFRAEIKKCFKADIPLSERTDWEDWITRDKAEIHRLSGEIANLEAEINTQVHALFDLTDEEIALLEANI